MKVVQHPVELKSGQNASYAIFPFQFCLHVLVYHMFEYKNDTISVSIFHNPTYSAY